MLTEKWLRERSCDFDECKTYTDIINFGRTVESAARKPLLAKLEAQQKRIDVLEAAVVVPEDVLNTIAEIETCVDEHDDNGPGSITCLSCSHSAPMQWRHGYRLDKPEDIMHSSSCPAIWARSVLAALNPAGETE